MKQTRYNHKKYYRNSENRSLIGKFQVTTGMLITFRYPSKGDKRPLVFVMDTDEFAAPDKKKFSGINLNYLPYLQIERLFVQMLSRAGWDRDKHTQIPKVNLWEEEDAGVRPLGIYKTFIKTLKMS